MRNIVWEADDKSIEGQLKDALGLTDKCSPKNGGIEEISIPTDFYIQAARVQYSAQALKYQLNPRTMKNPLYNRVLTFGKVPRVTAPLALALLTGQHDTLHLRSGETSESLWWDEENTASFTKEAYRLHSKFYEYQNESEKGRADKSLQIGLFMKLHVKNADLQVVSADGGNYYYSETNQSANLMFGGFPEPHSEQEVGVPSNSEVDQSDGNECFKTRTSLPAMDKLQRTFCDVWGSFQNISLAYVAISDQADIPIVADLFNETVRPFMISHPISMIADGINNTKGKQCRYYTKLRFETPDDMNRFYALRRVIKRFMLSLFALGTFTPSGSPITGQLLGFCRFKDTFNMCLDNYNHRDILDFCGEVAAVDITNGSFIPLLRSGKIYNDQHPIAMYDDYDKANKEIVDLSCGVEFADIRLNFHCDRALDPTWDCWVPCRAYLVDSQGNPCNHAFAKNRFLPSVYYSFHNPEVVLMKTKNRPMIQLYTNRKKNRAERILSTVLESMKSDSHENEIRETRCVGSNNEALLDFYSSVMEDSPVTVIDFKNITS